MSEKTDVADLRHGCRWRPDAPGLSEIRAGPRMQAHLSRPDAKALRMGTGAGGIEQYLNFAPRGLHATMSLHFEALRAGGRQGAVRVAARPETSRERRTMSLPNEEPEQKSSPNGSPQEGGQGLPQPQTPNFAQNQGAFPQSQGAFPQNQVQAPHSAAYGSRQPVASGMNPLAIASLACSILGIVTALLGIPALALLLPIAGVILGHVALNDIRKTGKGGKPEAIAGTVIGYIAAILAVLVIMVLKGIADILG